MAEQIVVTGAGLVCSLGDTPEGLWSALLAGRRGVGAVAGLPAGTLAAQVVGLDADSLGLPPRDARIMGRHSCMLLTGARAAHRAAGLGAATAAGGPIAFFAGMGMVDYRVEDLQPALPAGAARDGGIDYDAFFASGYRQIHPLWPLSMLNNISFCQAAIDLGITGDNAVFSPHADAGALAIVEGAQALLEGRALAALAGGVSEVVSAQSLARAGGHGTILGEGCGIVCLETLAAAGARGARAAARLLGYGCSCGRQNGAPGPSAAAIEQALRQALAAAELDPADVALVIAHRDGAVAGDRAEAAALAAVFGAGGAAPAVYASKPALGNCLAAGPALDLILACRVLESGLVPVAPRPARPGAIAINACSPEGQCVCLLVGAAG
jgi:3-oxoacyl-[acyl-carrier-protein] synthase II